MLYEGWGGGVVPFLASLVEELCMKIWEICQILNLKYLDCLKLTVYGQKYRI